MANYDAIDLDFTWDGDFYNSQDGDLADNKDDQIRSLENEIRNVVKSEFGDWELNPHIGANMSEYKGEPNTRDVGQNMQTRLKSRLVAAGIVKAEDVSVRVVPVGVSKVMIIIRISANSTPNNRLTGGEPLTVNLLYDSLEDGVFFFDKSTTEKNARSMY